MILIYMLVFGEHIIYFAEKKKAGKNHQENTENNFSLLIFISWKVTVKMFIFLTYVSSRLVGANWFPPFGFSYVYINTDKIIKAMISLNIFGSRQA
jgi:heme/copper-type cytochrome/quinol oxidase subunit 3